MTGEKGGERENGAYPIFSIFFTHDRVRRHMSSERWERFSLERVEGEHRCLYDEEHSYRIVICDVFLKKNLLTKQKLSTKYS